MRRQRGAEGDVEGLARGRARLTDQALVACQVARRSAAEGARPATVTDVLIGLATEPDGRAGSLLRAHTAALTRLTLRAGTASPRLPAAEVVVGWAAREARPRPVATLDLLAAAVEVGGSELAELLESCGLPPQAFAGAASAPVLPRGFLDEGALAETYGWDPHGDPLLELPAARAVARTRAVAGGALELLAAASLEAEAGTGVLPFGPEELAEAFVQLRAELADPSADRGLEAVLEAARAGRLSASKLGLADLAAAAAVGGGPAPARVLARACGEEG